MDSAAPKPLAVMLKTMVTHTVTYIVMGAAAYILFNYSRLYADPVVRGFMRQTNEPILMLGPMLQPIRGLAFGLVLFLLREPVLQRRLGWVTAWVVLVVVGVVSTFGPSPGSMEGMIYTVLPLWFHVVGLPEVLLQALLLSVIAWYWIRNPQKKWLTGVMTAAFVILISLCMLGLIAALSPHAR